MYVAGVGSKNGMRMDNTLNSDDSLLGFDTYIFVLTETILRKVLPTYSE